MEKIVVSIIGITFRVFLRYWAKNSNNPNIISSSFIEIEQFAEKCGLDYLEAKKFNRTIDDFVDIITRDFIYEFGTQIESTERKEAILLQIQNDIQKINLNEETLLHISNNPNTLQSLVMEQSKQERISWDSVEQGIYSNCVKYVSKMGMDFISKLPSFSSSALNIIVQRQEEYHNELHHILLEIRSMTNLVKSSETKYREYERIYREKVIEKYGKIELIGSKLQDRYITINEQIQKIVQ